MLDQISYCNEKLFCILFSHIFNLFSLPPENVICKTYTSSPLKNCYMGAHDTMPQKEWIEIWNETRHTAICRVCPQEPDTTLSFLKTHLTMLYNSLSNFVAQQVFLYPKVQIAPSILVLNENSYRFFGVLLPISPRHNLRGNSCIWHVDNEILYPIKPRNDY